MLKNIGRNTKNEIVLSEAEISNFHAQLILDDDNNIFINDLNSENGTYVNGNRISEPTQLKKDDIVKIAGIHFQWETHVPHSPTVRAIHTVPSNNDTSEVNENISAPNKKSSLFYFGISLIITAIILTSGYVLNEFFLSDNANNISENEKTESDPSSSDNTDSEIEIDCEVKEYDYSCLEDDEDMGTTEVINIFRDILNEGVDLTTVDVSVEEEEEFGDDIYNDIKQDFSFIQNDNRLDKLEKILDRLEREIPNKQGFNYTIYLVKSKDDPDMINAFTAGGRIYFTTAMYDFCENDDERASIIGHEINHNELGHIKEKLKIIKSSNLWLPDSGDLAAGVFGTFTTPFNQKNESECDLHGIDLCKCAGYELCSTVDLWNRMKEDEGEYNVIESLFRSHPYSQKREDCAKHHIQSNYQHDCD